MNLVKTKWWESAFGQKKQQSTANVVEESHD